MRRPDEERTGEPAGMDRQDRSGRRRRHGDAVCGAVGNARPRRRTTGGGNAAAAAVALAVFPAAVSAIRSRSRRPRETRRLPAADSAARGACGRAASSIREPLRDRRCADPNVDDRGGDREIRPQRPAGLRPRAPRDPSPRRGGGCARRISRHRLPRSAEAGRRRADAQGGAGAKRVGAPLGTRRRAALSLFGADVQQPSDPLRSPLRHGGRRLSRDSSCTAR